MRWIVLALAGIFFWPTAALGWGNPGHAAVCQIAYLNLTATARNEVDRLVPLGPRGSFGSRPMQAPYESFSRACTFPDNPHTRGDDHFVNYDRSLRAVTARDICRRPVLCIFAAIEEDFDRLRSTANSDAVRARALFFFGHWIGDLHQPLHISFEDDHGGGWIDTTGPCLSNPPRNDGLHTVWDRCLVEQVFRTVRVRPGNQSLPPTTPQNQWTNAVAAADFLNRSISAANRAAWIRSEPWQWAGEGYRLTLSPGVRYCVTRNSECWYTATDRLHLGGEDGARKTVAITQTYLNTYRPRVAQRLQMAGVRLAHMLNMALDPAYRAAHP